MLKVETDLKELEKHLSSVRKWDDCSTALSQGLYQKVYDVLKELDESLSFVRKWGEGSKDLFQDPYKSAKTIFEDLQKADNDNLITDKIDDIAWRVREIKMQRLPFLKLFNLWSSKAEAITESNNQSKEVKEKVQKVKNDLRELDKSLSLVSKWDEVSVVQFESLHEKSSYFFERFENAPRNNTDKPSSSKESDQDRLIDEIAQEIRDMRRQAHPFLQLLPERHDSDGPATISPTEWNRVESEEETLASPYMADVRSTYDDLDPHLKCCFLCLSIFPENSVIPKRSLIYLWIGEGLVEGEEVEKIGDDYFRMLCESGLIERIYKKESRSPTSCKLHPWIRWMAIHIAKVTMFFDFDADGRPSSGPSNCPRRACISKTIKREGEEVDLKLEEWDSSDLQMLFNIDVHFLEFSEEDIKKHTNMTTLQLGQWNNSPEYHVEVAKPTFLKHLGLLKRLRYLSLRGVSKIRDLPESIQQLSDLRVLDLRACHTLNKLPSGITSLKKLTHLDVSECYLLEYMPKGLGSLSNLQFLDGFVVSNVGKQEACKLGDLYKLEKLRKLGIIFGVLGEGVMSAELASIQYIKALYTLTITWGQVLSSNDDKTKKAPVRAKSLSVKTLARKQTTSSKILLKLPPILEKIDLRCFPEEDAPELIWGKVEPCLKKLYFRGGNLRSLNGINRDDQVSQVTTVRLRFLKNFNITKTELETMFPKLKYVEFHKCQEITTSFASDKAGDGDKQDEANTSKSAATSGSSVVYRIITHDGTDASNEDKVN